MKKNLLIHSIFSLFAIISQQAMAASSSNLHYDILKNGININSYKQCQKLINQCPKNGPYPDESCITQTVNRNTVCQQMKQLAALLDASAGQLNIKQLGNINIVAVIYLADGKKHYYLVTPDGSIIDTQVDPRQIDKRLDKKYHDAAFFTVNWGEPHYYRSTDGTQTFLVTLKITDSCAACKIIGWSKIKFIFANDGKFIKKHVESFTHDYR